MKMATRSVFALIPLRFVIDTELNQWRYTLNARRAAAKLAQVNLIKP